MTLKLVSDNVTELPVGNVRDLPQMLRYLADDIEAGELGSLTSLVTVLVRDDGLGIRWAKITHLTS
jgi:hypothetical protein